MEGNQNRLSRLLSGSDQDAGADLFGVRVTILLDTFMKMSVLSYVTIISD